MTCQTYPIIAVVKTSGCFTAKLTGANACYGRARLIGTPTLGLVVSENIIVV